MEQVKNILHNHIHALRDVLYTDVNPCILPLMSFRRTLNGQFRVTTDENQYLLGVILTINSLMSKSFKIK